MCALAFETLDKKKKKKKKNRTESKGKEMDFRAVELSDRDEVFGRLSDGVYDGHDYL